MGLLMIWNETETVLGLDRIKMDPKLIPNNGTSSTLEEWLAPSGPLSLLLRLLKLSMSEVDLLILLMPFL
jgi:hypothetical protein